MSKEKPDKLGYIRTELKVMMRLAKDFEEKRQALETAMKFESLQHKVKGNEYGKGFDDPGDDDAENF